jgi:hypothetical protein
MNPMDYEEVAYRLLGTKDNVEPNLLPEPIIQFYSEIVEYATNKFAVLQQQLDDNEHHIKVLHHARENGKPPNFLKMQAPEVRLLPAESVSVLQKSFREILDKAALDMLTCTLKERHVLRAKLCREAEQLIEEVKKVAMTKWMEAQGNGWDHLYPVTAEVNRGDSLVRLKVPLSSNVFRIALKECRAKVSTLMETKRLEKTQEAAQRRKESRLRRQALNEASALPRQEAEKSIQRQVQDMIRPLFAEVQELKEQLQGNRSAPARMDAGGASTKSTQKSREQSTTHNSTKADQDAASDARGGKKKRRRRSAGSRKREDCKSTEADHDAASETQGGRKKRRQRAAEWNKRVDRDSAHNDPASETQRGKKLRRQRSAELISHENPSLAPPSSSKAGDSSKRTESGKGRNGGGSRSEGATEQDSE